MLGDQRVYHAGSLDVGKVRRAVDDGDLALRYGRGDSACLIDRSSKIVRAGDVSVGAEMRGRSPSRSRRALASQHAAYPSLGVAASISRTSASIR